MAALFFFSWTGLFVALFLYWVTGGLGLGYHRLLTHCLCHAQRVEVPPPRGHGVGRVRLWVAIHRKHHQFSKEGDPHSPRDGKWWSHAGWILVGHSLRQDVSTLKGYVPDLAEDKVHVWLTKNRV